jgi:hypothetical protein
MSGKYNARTERDCRCMGLKRTQKGKENTKKNVGASYNM